MFVTLLELNPDGAPGTVTTCILEEAAEEPYWFTVVIVTVYVILDVNPVIVYGDDVTPVVTTFEPDVGTAVIVYDVTVPITGVNEIVAVVEVTFEADKSVGGVSTVYTVKLSEDEELPVVFAATNETLYTVS